MAPQKLTDYERKRLENIRRNNEMMAALKVKSKASELSKKVVKKSSTVKSEKNPKTETPIVIRRSLRSRGIPPDSSGLDLDAGSDSKTGSDSNTGLDSNTVTHNSRIDDLLQTLDPIPMKDVYKGIDDSDRSFIESLVAMSNKEFSEDEVDGNSNKKMKKSECSLELESLSLDPKNIVRVVPGRITQMRFFPSNDFKMVVAGNKFGDVGFWNVGESDVFLYHPHQAPISGISFQPHCLSKIYTSCYDGIIRLMDAEKEIFDMVYNSDECIYALAQPTNEANCLYFAEGSGGLTVWDKRIGKCSSQWDLHQLRINSIDFNPQSPHIVATSSSDRTACIWDLRCIGGPEHTALRTFTHKGSVHSAYFSPSGSSLATTSLDNTIGIYSGVNMEDATSVYHFNQTGKWVSTFKAIWGWDDSYLFIGNMRRGVDIVSTVQREKIRTLQSPHMSAIPCRFDVHSYEVGMLAGATSGGQVYVWTSSLDNTIGIYSGVNMEDATSVYHFNQTGKWVSTFKAIWGWDDSYLFIGNMRRGVDIVSTVQREKIRTLQSPHMSAIPCRFDVHSYEVGMLAGATSGGQVYVWTSS